MLTATPVFAADYYNWNDRTDRDGKPAGIYTTTPFPVDENSTTYSITNDEGTKTYVLGTLYFVDGAMVDDSGDGLSLATAKKTIGAALTAAGSGNKTILIRGAHDAFDGVYYLTYTSMTTHYGTDDTHRFSLIGYKQERPIIDGSTNYCNGGCTALFGGSAVDTYNTFQRLKVQNNPRETFQFGTATHGVKTGKYLNIIDVWSYQGGYTLEIGTHTGGDSSTVLTDSTKTWTADRYIGASIMNVTDTITAGTSEVSGAVLDNDGTTITTSGSPAMGWNNGDQYAIYTQSNGLYFMNADYGVVMHSTIERNSGHGLKFADGSSYGVIEWNNIIDSGYWAGKTPAVFYSRGVGLDIKADYPSDADYGINNIVRYNIVNGSVGHGLSIIGQSGISAHHNEVTGWAAACNMSGTYGGVTFKGLYLTNQYTSGNIYSNIIHDPSSCYTGITPSLYPYLFVDEVTNGQSSVVNIYNNIFYGFTAPNGIERHIISIASNGIANFYNNTVYANQSDGTGNARMFWGGTTATPGLVSRNNIFWNTGTGQTVRYYVNGPDASHTNNLYYYPSGSRGVNVGSETGMVDAQDPLFVSLPSGAYVYGMGMIQSNSPAKNAGADLSATFTTDHNLTSRPLGSAWDIGAYEASSSPSLTTSAPTFVSSSTLTLNANISATGGASITQSGFAYGTSSNLSSVISTTTLGTQSTGNFSGGITGLTPNTLYYFRAYAVNSLGTSTGSILSTTTLATSTPTVTTQAVFSITSTTATGNGTITATGYINPTARGVSYGLTTAYGATTTLTGDFSAEAFTSSISGLTCNTLYHVKAYATNSEGTGYGEDVAFTTGACSPTLTTSSASSITTTAATLNGNLSATGGANPTEHGFAWGTASDLTTGTATTTEGAKSGTGVFTSSLSSLTCATTYYARAYATNSADTNYGDIVSFTTSACPVAAASATTQTTSSGSSASTRMANLREIYAQNNIPCPESVCGSGVGSNVASTPLNTSGDTQNQLSNNTNLPGAFPQVTDDTVTGVNGSPITPSSISSTLEGLKDLPSEIITLVNKFPEIGRTIAKIAKTAKTDVITKLRKTPLTIPTISKKANSPSGVPISSLTSEQKKLLPSDVIFAKSGDHIDYNVSLVVTNEGKAEQVIKTVGGRSIDLALKPDKPVKEIKGYLTVKKIERIQAKRTIQANSLLTASIGSLLSQTKKEKPVIEEKLVLSSFNYADTDGDGIYTASVISPLIHGEYDIMTIMTYKDEKQGSKEFHLTTVVDPEGYIYMLNKAGETRLKDAKVTILWKNPKTSGYETWPAAKYKQNNPQKTDATGMYSFLVPEGKYKLTVTASGYYDYNGKEFEVIEGQGIHENIEMKQKGWLRMLLEKLGLR